MVTGTELRSSVRSPSALTSELSLQPSFLSFTGFSLLKIFYIARIDLGTIHETLLYICFEIASHLTHAELKPVL